MCSTKESKCGIKKELKDEHQILPNILGYIIVAIDWPEKQTVTLKGQRTYSTAALDLAQQISLCAGTAALPSLLAGREGEDPAHTLTLQMLLHTL